MRERKQFKVNFGFCDSVTALQLGQVFILKDLSRLAVHVGFPLCSWQRTGNMPLMRVYSNKYVDSSHANLQHQYSLENHVNNGLDDQHSQIFPENILLHNHTMAGMAGYESNDGHDTPSPEAQTVMTLLTNFGPDEDNADRM